MSTYIRKICLVDVDEEQKVILESVPKAVPDYQISEEKNEERFVIIDKNTNILLDDNNGHGYTSGSAAHRCYAYKTRDISQDAEKDERRKKIERWLEEHYQFNEQMVYEYCMIMPKYKENGKKFDTDYLKKRLKENDLELEEFKAGELLRVWLKENFID